MRPLFLIRPALFALAAAASLLAGACTYSHGDPAPACDVTSRPISYADVVSPIFDANCRECHATDKASTLGGGNDFGNYQTIKQYPNDAMLGSIEQARGYDPMPKGRARISDCDIARIKSWMAAGKPQN